MKRVGYCRVVPVLMLHGVVSFLVRDEAGGVPPTPRRELPVSCISIIGEEEHKGAYDICTVFVRV